MEAIVMNALIKLSSESARLSSDLMGEDDATKRSQISYRQVLASAGIRAIALWRIKKLAKPATI